jgi:hypothetical protein
VWNTLHQGDAPTPGRDGQIFPTISEWWDEMITGKPKKEQKCIFMGKRLTYVEV